MQPELSAGYLPPIKPRKMRFADHKGCADIAIGLLFGVLRCAVWCSSQLRLFRRRDGGPVKLTSGWAHARHKLKVILDRDGSPIAADGPKRITALIDKPIAMATLAKVADHAYKKRGNATMLSQQCCPSSEVTINWS